VEERTYCIDDLVQEDYDPAQVERTLELYRKLEAVLSTYGRIGIVQLPFKELP